MQITADPKNVAINPKYTISELNILEDKVRNNSAIPEDYKKLDDYLLFLGMHNRYIQSKLREEFIEDYSDFVYKRRKHLFEHSLSILIGNVLGAIFIIKSHISGA